ncbi:MAG TPA: peptidylprolyl isomerase, partial [Gemmatimonadales bacterium]
MTTRYKTEKEVLLMRRIAQVILLGVAVCAASVAQAEGKNPMVLISTSMGDIKVELYPEKAPETVKNFLAYVNDKF